MRKTPGLVACILLSCAAAQAAPLDAAESFAASQAVIGQPAPAGALLDREGRPLDLSRYRGKPLLVSFIYAGCFQACPTTTRTLHEAVSKTNGTLGAHQFNVVSIGFNQPADSPQAMKAFAQQFRVGTANWDFLSVPPAQVDPLTRGFGFRFEPSASGIDHTAQVTLVDAQGRIVRQIYGERLSAEDIAEPIRQLLRAQPLDSRTTWGDLVDRIRILCTVYDPQTGTYRASYGLALEIAGGLTFLVAMMWFFIAEWRGNRRSKPR